MEALEQARVALLLGPRQAGKSTIANQLVKVGKLDRVVSLDAADVRDMAMNDPIALVGRMTEPTAIDEVQRVPDLLLEVKRKVDHDNRRGQFLLTGSANILTAPKVLDALTGRTRIVRLWPLSCDEIEAGLGSDPFAGLGRESLIDSLLGQMAPAIEDAPLGIDAWAQRGLAGGFPEVLTLPDGRARESWFADMIESFVLRDLRDISDIQKARAIPALLRHLAGTVTSPLNVANLSQRTGVPRNTIDNYLGLIETGFMTFSLPAWRPGVAGRERRAPKTYFVDTGVLSHLLEASIDAIEFDSRVSGAIFENFVAVELQKLAAWSDRSTTLMHYRREGEEIDFILQTRSGQFIALEAKASATLGFSDWKPLSRLRDARPDHFLAGAVIHPGAETVQLSERIWALPVSALWGGTRPVAQPTRG